MEIFLNVMLCFIIFMLGACFGSFFNVVLLRLPKKENFINTRSYCPECGKTLLWYELIPFFSYVFQGGRCRNCQSRIKPQYLLMEIICGGGNVWAYLVLGFSYETLIAFILFPVLTALSAEDIKKTEIPYWCTVTIAALGLIATAISFTPLSSRALWYEHLLGTVIIALPFAVFCYLGAMGGGDVQLTAAAGLLLGWAIVPSVLIAMLTGGVFGLVIKLTKKRATICFGPFLSVGIAAGYLYGYDVIKWYAGFLGG
ncbi:MAG: prepilin peptidase [Oscillospiraceae bacterium]|nr:prepilin peptidase [Oscillospiraceae bacterium]